MRYFVNRVLRAFIAGDLEHYVSAATAATLHSLQDEKTMLSSLQNT